MKERMTKTRFLILGGGMVAGYAAKELAEHGLKSGELAIVSSDGALPYERPPLSKGFLAGKDTEDAILINQPDFYSSHGVEVKLNTTIEAVDVEKQSLRSSSGEEFEFEKLVLATGCVPRKLDCPGADLPGVFYLRVLDDSKTIRDHAAQAKKSVVVGGGFIGMEVASVLAQKNIETTMVVREDRIWKRFFTPRMSSFFEKYYTDRGVRILKQTGIKKLEGSDSLKNAVLDNGEKVAASLLVAGLGVTPVTDLFKPAGFKLDNGVVVNQSLATNHQNIYAAGDIANYPDAIFEKRRRVEHWDNAVSQGQYCARALSGDHQPYVHVPYFFSDVFDLSYDLWGDPEEGSDTVIRGDAETSSFSVWWLKNDRLVATFAMNRPDDEREAAPKWIESKQLLSPIRLREQTRSVQDAVQD